jgi:hypothetical protein
MTKNLGRNVLLALSLKYNGFWPHILKAIKEKEVLPEDDIHSAPSRLPDGVSFVAITDDHYPVQFKDAKYPPFIIYYKGDLALLNDSQLSGVSLFGNLIWDEHKDNAALKAKANTIVNYSYLSDGSVADSIQSYKKIYIADNITVTPDNSPSLIISERPFSEPFEQDVLDGFAYRLLFAISFKVLFVGCKRFKDIVFGLGILSSLDSKKVFSLKTAKETSTNTKLINDANAHPVASINDVSIEVLDLDNFISA